MIDEHLFDVDAPLYIPRRFNHAECSKGKDSCLMVTRFPTKWKYYCHRCKEYGEKLIDGLSPKDVVKLWKARSINKSQTVDTVSLPDDFTNKIPIEGIAWLMKYDITEEEIAKYNIGYSPLYKRVIFPVYEEDTLVYWQGRKVNSNIDSPKWINIKQKGREDIYFKTGDGDWLVLVEDILSAIKVGRVVSSIALLGSYVSKSLIISLSKDERTKYIWLDKDKRGYAVKTAYRMCGYGIKLYVRITDKDPKEYQRREIRKILLTGGL